jgi:GNAT superfamily N-acetyltransferase
MADAARGKNEPVIRYWAKIANYRPIMAIEKAVFRFPWKQAVFEDTLDEDTCSAITAEINGEIVGYAVVERQHDRFYIVKLAVAPSVTRKGIGKALIDEIKNIAAKLGKRMIEFDVRESLLDSQLFLASPKIAFKAIDVVREGFRDYVAGNETPVNVEDAYKFIFDLPPAPGQPAAKVVNEAEVLVACCA